MNINPILPIEICKKLKDIGYNVPSKWYYKSLGETIPVELTGDGVDSNGSKENVITAPLADDVLEWFYKSHSLWVSFTPESYNGLKWNTKVYLIGEFVSQYNGIDREDDLGKAKIDSINILLDNHI